MRSRSTFGGPQLRSNPLERMKLIIYKHIAIVVSIGLYALSLTQDAYYIAGDDPKAWASGWVLLLLGWIGAIGFDAGLAWFANPLLFISWVMHFTKNELGSVKAGAVATAFALSFLLFDKVISSEAPTYSEIIGYGFGYWLWLSSCAIIGLQFMPQIIRWLNKLFITYRSRSNKSPS